MYIKKIIIIIMLHVHYIHTITIILLKYSIIIISLAFFSVLRLLKMAKGIRALLDTVMQALPQVGNLGLLFFLLFFIFAALGVELFGRLGKCIELLYCHNDIIWKSHFFKKQKMSVKQSLLIKTILGEEVKVYWF